MKNFILLVVFLAPTAIQAQFVGVGTSTPLAPMHIFSSGQEVLRIEGTNPYISIFDYKEGERGYFSYRPSTSAPGINSIDISSAVGSALPVTISPVNVVTATFLPNGNVGINTITPAEKLDVNGNLNLSGVLKLNNSSGSAGQLLVSNGATAPTWQNPPSLPNANPTVGFNAILNANTPIGNSLTALTNFYEFFDTQNNFNAASGVFTAPATGVYHFDMTLVFSSITTAVNATITFKINDITFGGCQKPVFLSPTGIASSFSHSVTIPLNANATVTCFASQDNGSTINARGGPSGLTSSVLSGYRIY